jgi:hypothetical protein
MVYQFTRSEKPRNPVASKYKNRLIIPSIRDMQGLAGRKVKRSQYCRKSDDFTTNIKGLKKSRWPNIKVLNFHWPLETYRD